MCWICEAFEEAEQKAKQREIQKTEQVWSNRFTFHALDFPPIPEPPEEKKEQPKIAIDELSDQGRDIIGLVRANVKTGYAENITESGVLAYCLATGVPRSEIKSIMLHSMKIKAEAPQGMKPGEIIQQALLKAFM